MVTLPVAGLQLQGSRLAAKEMDPNLAVPHGRLLGYHQAQVHDGGNKPHERDLELRALHEPRPSLAPRPSLEGVDLDDDGLPHGLSRPRHRLKPPLVCLQERNEPLHPPGMVFLLLGRMEPAVCEAQDTAIEERVAQPRRALAQPAEDRHHTSVGQLALK